MKNTVFTLMLLLLFSICSFAQTNEQVILQLEAQLLKAKLSNDVATLVLTTLEQVFTLALIGKVLQSFLMSLKIVWLLILAFKLTDAGRFGWTTGILRLSVMMYCPRISLHPSGSKKD